MASSKPEMEKEEKVAAPIDRVATFLFSAAEASIAY